MAFLLSCLRIRVPPRGAISHWGSAASSTDLRHSGDGGGPGTVHSDDTEPFFSRVMAKGYKEELPMRKIQLTSLLAVVILPLVGPLGPAIDSGA